MTDSSARSIIETILRSALAGLEHHPERSVRNMIDMAMSSCQGRFSPRFFACAQRMLEDEQSGYYPLIRSVAANVDHERLLAFGMNVGYNACTLGAQTIRRIEAERHFNIPWALYLAIESGFLRAHEAAYSTLIRQAKALGIYAFFIDAAGVSPEQINLMHAHDDCAFVLMLGSAAVTPDVIDSLVGLHHVMLSVCADSGAFGVCRALQNRRMLYAVHMRYGKGNTASILSGEAVRGMLRLGGTFTAFVARSDCPASVRRLVYEYAVREREAQRFPTIVCELAGDARTVDAVISDDGVTAGFLPGGTFFTVEKTLRRTDYTMLSCDLCGIFKAVLAK